MANEKEKLKEAIEDHFSSKAEGFSNPNKEPKSDVKEADEKIEETPTQDDNEFNNNKLMTYHERLKALNISDKDAHALIDDICEKGSFIEGATIRKEREGKPEIKAVFITRDTRSQGFIAAEAAKKHQNIPMIYEKIMGELQLAASVLHYNGNNFKPLSTIEDNEEFEKEIRKRVQEFSKLPAPITVVLGRKLAKFDLKVTAVMAPGYEDFF